MVGRIRSLLYLYARQHPTQRPGTKCNYVHYYVHRNKNSKTGGENKFPCYDQQNNDNGGGKRLHLLKSRGQHLLVNQRVLDSIVTKSNIRPTDTVLEIGPGTGNLTLKLLQLARKVVAVEVDKRMVDILNERVAQHDFQDRITVINNDALKIVFPEVDLVVANIPYGISSPLIAKLVFESKKFRSATLLLQKEFARRLLANPGDSEFNRLAVNVKLVADVEHIMNVSKKEFIPIPKVDSSVIKIWPKKDDIPNVDLNEWLAFTRVCFGKKNKTLGATFKQKKKLRELIRLSTSSKVVMAGLHDQGSNVGVDVLLGTKSTSLCSGLVEGDVEYEDDVISDDEEERSEMSIFREKVIGILTSNGFEDKRPSKLSIQELLHLLALFNENQVYFCDKYTGAVQVL